MGKIRKWTGADAQINAARANAAAQEESTKQAADAQLRTLTDSARAAAQQQTQIAARLAAENKASAAATAPLATADVQLDETGGADPAAQRRTRRAAFGRSYNSGVNL
jgi:hypothetical protein